MTTVAEHLEATVYMDECADPRIVLRELGIPPDMPVATLRRALALVAWVDDDRRNKSVLPIGLYNSHHFHHLRTIGVTPDTGGE